jgi:hypothetical protein
MSASFRSYVCPSAACFERSNKGMYVLGMNAMTSEVTPLQCVLNSISSTILISVQTSEMEPTLEALVFACYWVVNEICSFH